jgi:hypothetical protein
VPVRFRTVQRDNQHKNGTDIKKLRVLPLPGTTVL